MKTIGGYHIKYVIAINVGQQGLSIKRTDRQPRLIRNIAIRRLQRSAYKRPGVYAICDCDQLHHNIALE